LNSKPKEEFVAVARIVRTRGLKGEVVAEVLTDFPKRFEGLERVIAFWPNGDREELKLEGHWFQKNRIILKFEGYDTVESGERFRGAEICVSESEAVHLEPDEYFDWKLAGCTVVTLDGNEIGIIREIMRTGGTDILVVQGEEKEFLIPFAETICVEIDIDKKVIRIDPPDGLLEF